MRKSKDPVFFPILINLQKFSCLVVGGGDVAHRKILTLQKFNADITVISPKVSESLIELSQKRKIKLIKRKYSKEYLKNFEIVFCATNNSHLNKIIHDDCMHEGILINVADEPALCDFILPANIKRGDLTISISSQGKAPFFAKAIREKLENIILPIYADIIDLAGTFREQLLISERAKSAKYKSKMFRKFILSDWEKILIREGKKKSKIYANKILKDFNSF
jgi:precorrin-2 dehydrogenase/sirohydrochlorin ferrochelatase